MGGVKIEPLLGRSLHPSPKNAELCRNLGDGVRSGGVVDRHLDDLDTVLESDSFDELGQLVLTL